MAIMDKLLFWRHKSIQDTEPPDLGLGEDRKLGLDISDEPYEPGPVPPQHSPQGQHPQQFEEPDQEQERSAFAQHQQNYPQQSTQNKDIEIISAKLDALKATLDNINHRLEQIERMAREGV